MLCNSRGRFRNAFSWHEKLLVRQFRETLLYMEGLSRKVQYNKSIHHKNRGVQGNLMCSRIYLINLFTVSDIGQTKGISFIILFVILFYNIISCCKIFLLCLASIATTFLLGKDILKLGPYLSGYGGMFKSNKLLCLSEMNYRATFKWAD